MTPEEHAIAVLSLIESDFGQSGRDVRLLALRDQFEQAIQDEREACAKLADGLRLSVNGIEMEAGQAWVADAIRNRK